MAQDLEWEPRRRIALTKRFLEDMGIDRRRLQASWVSASESVKFADVVSQVVKELKEIGPNKLFVSERNSDATEAQAKS